MGKRFYKHITGLLLPCLFFSVLTGALAAIWISGFKLVAELVIHLSALAFAAVRENPVWIFVLVLGAAVIGLMASGILSVSNSCKGGGIPTSAAAVQGIFSFRFIAGLILLPVSALLTFLAGLPLGTEGPCVQMGTAVGDGVMWVFGKEKYRGWRRYIMTGGASAGFSIATSSPISAIIFSMEELHKHFSPMLLSVASISVITAEITASALSRLNIFSFGFFDIPEIAPLPFSAFFAPVILGIISGVVSILFTRLYHRIDRLMRLVLERISTKILLPVLFALVAIVGFFFVDTLGSGHSLIESLFTRSAVWYALILLFLARAIGMMVSNTSGATGGVFLPTLAFGAIIGALCADGMIALGLIEEEHYLLMVALGVCAFLGATSRIPLTACVFGIEALCMINNVLPVVLATTVAMLIVESSGLDDLTDKIIEAKLHKITNGRRPVTVEVPLVVSADAFAVGKELRDVLWPSACVVVSFKRARHDESHSVIGEGDVITVRYDTYDPPVTERELSSLVGRQSEEIMKIMQP